MIGYPASQATMEYIKANLLSSCLSCNIFSVKYILSSYKEYIPSFINMVNLDNQNLLHIAADNENKTIVKMLIGAGCNKRLQDNKGRTPLDIAVDRCNIGLINVFLDDAEYINLDLAISKIHATNFDDEKRAYMYIIKLMVDKIQINNLERSINIGKNILIKIAALRNSEEIIKILLIKGAYFPVDQKNQKEYLADVQIDPEVLAEITERIKQAKSDLIISSYPSNLVGVLKDKQPLTFFPGPSYGLLGTLINQVTWNSRSISDDTKNKSDKTCSIKKPLKIS